jgi:hypothetical protein
MAAAAVAPLRRARRKRRSRSTTTSQSSSWPLLILVLAVTLTRIPSSCVHSFPLLRVLPTARGGGGLLRNERTTMVTMKKNNDSGQDPSFLFLAQLQYFLGGGGGGGTTAPFGGTAAAATATTASQNDATKKVPDTTPAGTTTTTAVWRTTAKRFLRTTFARLRQVSILPALVAFWIGYKIGVSRAVTTMADIVLAPTGRNVVASQPTTVRETLRTMVLATALIFLLVREFWRGVPRWVKRQLPQLILPRQLSSRILSQDELRRLDNDHEDESNMTSLPTIMRKLRSLLDLASDKLGLNNKTVDVVPPGSSSADMTTRNATATTTTSTSSSSSSSDNIESSMLVLLRLVRQIKEHRPDIRDAEFLAYDTMEKQMGDDAVITEYHRHMFELADAAYDELPQGQELRDFLSRSSGYELLRHDATVVPGSVAHYVAVNRDTKQAVVGVKGTSSLEDLLTDCCGVAVDHEGMRCHDGILTASKRLAADLETILVDLLLPRGYAVTLTGHSLVRRMHKRGRWVVRHTL